MRVEQIVCYKSREKRVQRLHETILVFVFAGQDWCRLTLPGGTAWPVDLAASPHILLATPGTVLDFSYQTPRETWALWLAGEGTREADDPRLVEIREGDAWIQLHRVYDLPPETIPYWQCELARMAACMTMPHPRNAFRVQCGLARILQQLLPEEPESTAYSQTPAEALKRRIDDDVACAFTLEALSAQCGYSRDYARECFFREFGVSPSQYRQRIRMAHVMNLIAESDLSLKEIAAQAGFRHLSHLSSLFRQTFGYPPREALTRFRYRL